MSSQFFNMTLQLLAVRHVKMTVRMLKLAVRHVKMYAVRHVKLVAVCHVKF